MDRPRFNRLYKSIRSFYYGVNMERPELHQYRLFTMEDSIKAYVRDLEKYCDFLIQELIKIRKDLK